MCQAKNETSNICAKQWDVNTNFLLLLHTTTATTANCAYCRVHNFFDFRKEKPNTDTSKWTVQKWVKKNFLNQLFKQKKLAYTKLQFKRMLEN